jgi:hypothetical protein
MEGLRLALPMTAAIKYEQQMLVCERLAPKGQRRQRTNLDAKFLTQFARQSCFGRLPALNLATRKLPESSHAPARRPLLHQNASGGVDQRRCDDDEDGCGRERRR